MGHHGRFGLLRSMDAVAVPRLAGLSDCLFLLVTRWFVFVALLSSSDPAATLAVGCCHRSHSDSAVPRQSMGALYRRGMQLQLQQEHVVC